MSSAKRGNDAGGPIVSSSHLADGGAPALSEFEYGLIIAGNAFNRWIVRCMAAAGYPDFNALDVLVVHSVNHRARDKRLADICFILAIEDSHLVSYALKKLVKAGLVEAERRGKETLFRTTPKGARACARYRAVREPCLVETVRALGNIDDREIADVARLLRALSGLYDQAARAAASL